MIFLHLPEHAFNRGTAGNQVVAMGMEINRSAIVMCESPAHHRYATVQRWPPDENVSTASRLHQVSRLVPASETPFAI
jgi:hypothetical protein